MAERWLTIKQAAEYFGGSPMRVYRRIWAGQLEASDVSIAATKQPRYAIRESSIAKYFETRQIAIPAARRVS